MTSTLFLLVLLFNYNNGYMRDITSLGSLCTYGDHIKSESIFKYLNTENKRIQGGHRSPPPSNSRGPPILYAQTAQFPQFLNQILKEKYGKNKHA